MAVCWEQEQPDGKAVTSSTSEVVSEITLNPEVMQIPPAPEGWSLLLLLNTSSRRRGRGNVVIPKGFPKSVGRRLYGFPPFPYSVISMACFRGTDQTSTFPKSLFRRSSTRPA